MKNSILIIILPLIILSSCTPKMGVLKQEGIDLHEGADLYYTVRQGDVMYPFNININEFNQDYISFDWDMGEINSGSIFISEAALDFSTAMHNYFTRGYKKLDDKTSVWLSKKLFKDLKSGKSVEIDLGMGVKETFTKTGTETYSFGDKGDGVPYNLPVFTVSNKDGSKEIWIADDPSNRLIVMMNIDFRIDLNNYQAFD